METPVWTLFYKAGIWVAGLFPAIFGAAFLVFSDREQYDKNKMIVPVLTFLFGVIIGYNGGGAVSEAMGIHQDTFISFSMKFTLGWMGIGILVQARQNIPEWLNAIKTRWIG
jgi:mannitol-specific phosphotransferase system IIBC component